MDVPQAIAELVLRKEIIAAPTAARRAENYGWVRLRVISPSLLLAGERNRLENPDAPLYLVYRWDIAKAIADDETSPANGVEDHTHIERYETQDIHAAFTRAAEYQPDWTKWDRIGAFDNCW